MKKTLTTGAAFSVVPRYVLGGPGYIAPNEKVQVAIIGTGNRMNLLIAAFLKQTDCAIAALCDVDKTRLTNFAAKFSAKADTYGDYRRILERKDIDAVVVATPDHWHAPIMVDACEAGKDVYLEKPVSNTIPAALRILEAAQKHKRVVQVGTQQRSWTHFQEAARMIQDGLIGNVAQVVVNHGNSSGGGVRQQPAQPEPVPEGFDWEMWQGPAPRYPYTSARRSWRGWYDYGGGSITDWGVHYIDIVHMCMQYDVKAPAFTAAVVLENPNPERVPGTWMINYKYDDFLMSFMSCTQPSTVKIQSGPAEGESFYGLLGQIQGGPNQGPSFYGSQGYLLVNRSGYMIRPLGKGAVEAKDFPIPSPVNGERASEIVHVRNWLDCIKSRQKPTCDIEIGFNSSLPCLLGRQAVLEERALTWDPINKTAKKA